MEPDSSDKGRRLLLESRCGKEGPRVPHQVRGKERETWSEVVLISLTSISLSLTKWHLFNQGRCEKETQQSSVHEWSFQKSREVWGHST